MSGAVLFALGAVVGALVAAVFWLLDRQRLNAQAAVFQSATARLEVERDAAAAMVAIERERVEREQARIEELEETFQGMSRSALKENRDDFLQNAESLLGPVRETLERVRTQLAEVDKAREGSFREVRSHLGTLAQAQEQLRASADGLARAMKSSNVRGKWGEVQLRRIVELAGMLDQCDFMEKVSTTTEAGSRQTPDMIVYLPGNVSVVVDAKVPIDAYITASSAKTERERDEALALHARQLRDHMRTLGAKEYWKQFDQAPEFVVMFLPLEPLLGAAFEHEPAILEQAASLRVVLATPMTLLAILKAVGYGWRQQQLAQNAEEIQQLGRDLYDRLGSMVDHFGRVGNGIKQAADAYDRFIGSLEQKVLPSARRFRELGVSTTRELDSPEALTLSVRRARKPELIGADETPDPDASRPLFSPATSGRER